MSDPEPIGFAPPRAPWTDPGARSFQDLERLVRAYKRGEESAKDALAAYADPLSGLDALVRLFGREGFGFGRRARAVEQARVFGPAPAVRAWIESEAKERRASRREERKLARALDPADLSGSIPIACDTLAQWIIVPSDAGPAGVHREAVAGLVRLCKGLALQWEVDPGDLDLRRLPALVARYRGRSGSRGVVRFTIHRLSYSELRRAGAIPGKKIPEEWLRGASLA